ncbi:MAG: S24 family peptidase [Verrucomicrobiales bacterium]
MSQSENFPERLFSLRSNLGLSQGDMGRKMGLSLNYISTLERGKKEPSDSVVKMLELLEDAYNVGGLRTETSLKEDASLYEPSRPVRMVPVVGWAHAGEAGYYEELPESWHDKIATDCREMEVFGLRLEGDSMEPKFLVDDVLVVMKDVEPHSGAYCVLKYRDGGVVFRQVEFGEEGKLKLIPVNTRYPIEYQQWQDFEWIRPVFETRRLLWRNGKC